MELALLALELTVASDGYRATQKVVGQTISATAGQWTCIANRRANFGTPLVLPPRRATSLRPRRRRVSSGLSRQLRCQRLGSAAPQVFFDDGVALGIERDDVDVRPVARMA